MIAELATVIFALFALVIGVAWIVIHRHKLALEEPGKRKKELDAEISRLETELDRDQAQDREAL